MSHAVERFGTTFTHTWPCYFGMDDNLTIHCNYSYLVICRNGHPLNADSPILRTIWFVPTKSSQFVYKINLLITDTH